MLMQKKNANTKKKDRGSMEKIPILSSVKSHAIIFVLMVVLCGKTFERTTFRACVNVNLLLIHASLIQEFIALMMENDRLLPHQVQSTMYEKNIMKEEKKNKKSL